jgi:predicted pyridoxine 5'-phosphate oxidase superfamily flavin-nucleotide-binding protein
MTTRAAQGSPFHEGELTVQERSGVLEEADFLGRRMFRPFLTEQHREFFAQLPYLLVGSMDDQGQPWASMLFGRPGFVHSPEPVSLAIDAQVAAGDPLRAALRPDSALGVLGIQLHTRRRNRMNGHVRDVSAGGFTLQVDQSFGNCPKYISARVPVALVPPAAAAPPVAEGGRLSDAAVQCIETADTCFIASASAGALDAGDSREGVDVSHRGGRPGFVRALRNDNETTLYMPDFSGNNAFNTLGNLSRYPRAGLLFPDFASGDLLMLACTAEIRWDGPELAQFAGAERMLILRVSSGLHFPKSMPFRWSEAVPGPHVERTGRW